MKKISKILFLFLFMIILYACDKKTDTKKNTTLDNKIVITDQTTKENETQKQDKYYNVRFVNYDNNLLYETKIKEGDTPIYSSSNPTRSNDENYSYTFKGWNPSIGKVYGDTTYVATFESHELPYTINFDLDDGSSTDDIKTIKTDSLYKELFSFNIKKSGFVFDGWTYNDTLVFDASGNKVNDVTMESNMTFKAVYKEAVYVNIIYSLYNFKKDETKTYNEYQDFLGDVIKTTVIEHNQIVDLYANLGDEFVFEGWYKNGEMINNSSSFQLLVYDSDVTIELKLSYKKYYLTLESGYNGYVTANDDSLGSGWFDCVKVEAYYGESITIGANSSTDLRFLGWYDGCNYCGIGDRVSEKQVYTFTMPKTNLLYMPIWNSAPIYYNNIEDDGTNNPNNPTVWTNDMESVTLLPPTREGYTFLGWYCDFGPLTQVGKYVTAITKDDITDEWELHAEWEINKAPIYLVNEVRGTLFDGITSGNIYEYGTSLRISIIKNTQNKQYRLIRSDGYGFMVTSQGYSFDAPGYELTITVVESFPYLRSENKIYFGSYPQTLETDDTIISQLNAKAGELPTKRDKHNWTDYEYVHERIIDRFMWYIDIDLNNDGRFDYRGVYFIAYRPCYIGNSCDEIGSHMDDNGYLINNVYWFKFEPIEWDILYEKSGMAIIIANLCLDSQDFYAKPTSKMIGHNVTIVNGEYEYDEAYEYYYDNHNGGNGNYSNYALSNIRKWLNDDFYNTAFSSLEKGLIMTTFVNNSASSFGEESSELACETTEDKIFLLSCSEVEKYYPEKESKVAYCTDYAKCQGVDAQGESGIDWLTRSPKTTQTINIVNFAGLIQSWDCDWYSHGIRPALCINL